MLKRVVVTLLLSVGVCTSAMAAWPTIYRCPSPQVGTAYEYSGTYFGNWAFYTTNGLTARVCANDLSTSIEHAGGNTYALMCGVANGAASSYPDPGMSCSTDSKTYYEFSQRIHCNSKPYFMEGSFICQDPA